jgi:pimeloyl-ACP methyl ester carboxylesterase
MAGSPGAAAAVQAWADRGRWVDAAGHRVFVLDQPAADEQAVPVLVLHGFPSSSFDWRHVLPALSARRRVVLLDFLGFGLSDKPDRPYSMRLQADITSAVVEQLGLAEVALLSHDVGDTVGGELLARSLDGTLPFEVVRRVITNGSIYMDLVQLSDGQKFLLTLPDEALPLDRPADDWKDAWCGGVAGTFSSSHQPSADEMDAQWELAARDDGYRLLPRLIRYIEERRAEESRFTGAIQQHPSPLDIVWGQVDPIAVYPMALRLQEARPDARLTTLDDIGHYPMVEDPERFGSAVVGYLDA